MKSPMLGSVGAGGQNNKADTKFVQMLLNDWLGRKKKPLLKVDGLVGPKTLGAIKEFQSTNGLIADGRVDRSGMALKKMIALQFAGIAAGLIKNPLTSIPVDVQGEARATLNSGVEDTMQGYLAALHAALK